MRLRSVSFLVLLLLIPAAFAQPVTNAAPLDSADPRAQRATGLVSLLASGDFEAAKAYLRTHADPGSPDAAEQVESVSPLFAGTALEVDRVLAGRDGEVLVTLRGSGGGRGGRVAVIVDIESTPPYRVRGLRSPASIRSGGADTAPPPAGGAGDSMIGTPGSGTGHGSKGQVLSATAEHYAVKRAQQLVKALNDPKSAPSFIDDAWDLAATEETADAAVAALQGIRDRVGEGAVLQNVELGPGNDALARIVNRHGRKTTLLLDVGAAAPHRMRITGVEREIEEVTEEQATPKSVGLPAAVVTAPITFEDGRPFTEVYLEGKGPYRFMVETGFARISVTPRVIADLGTLAKPASGDTMYRIGEARISSIYDIGEMRIGKARLRRFRVSVTPKQPGVDGVLGLSTFANLLLTVDYPKQQLRLAKGALPEANGRDILPLRKYGAFVGVEVEIGGRKIPAEIDTQRSTSGGAGLSLTPQLAPLVTFESAPVEYGRALVGQTHETVATMARLADNAKLGRYTFERPLLAVMTFGTANADGAFGNIGADWLSHFAITLDQKHARVRFAASGSPTIAPPPSYRTYGVTAKRDGENLVVASVREDGPAARAGIRVGDVVVRFGGAEAKSLPRSVNALASNPKPVTVELLRNGAPVTVTMQSAVLVP